MTSRILYPHLEPFSVDEISDKISELLTPEEMAAEVKIIFQSIEAAQSLS